MAETTTTLKSSLMPAMNVDSCLSSRSTLASVPVRSSVVMATVAMERLGPDTRFSKSTLQGAMASGDRTATRPRMRTVAKRTTGRGEDRNICSAVTAGLSSWGETLLRDAMARAASKTTISDRWRRDCSRKG